MIDNSPPVRHILFAILGTALLVGGGYGTVVGINSLDVCGSSALVANELTDSSEKVVQFKNLSETQQELVRQSIIDERPAVTGDEWPYFESAVVVQYQGTYYRLYTVTTPCPVPHKTIISIGLLIVFLGIAAVVPISLWLVRLRRSE